jgi:diguanylate cyclase (GGDEF)-like protein
MSWWLLVLLAGTAGAFASAALATWFLGRKRRVGGARHAAVERPRRPLTLFERFADPILLLDRRGTISQANPAALKLFGQEVLRAGRPLSALLHEDDVAPAGEHLESVVIGEAAEPPLWRLRANGSWLRLRVQAANFLDDPEVEALVLVFRQELPGAGSSVYSLGVPPLRDALSGLGNKVFFRDRLQHALLRAQRRGAAVAVVLLDLGELRFAGLKPSQEEFEALLAQAGRRIAAFVRGEDSAARLEGTRFALVLEHGTGERGFVQVARRLAALFEEPLLLEGRRYMCRPTIGVAVAESGDEGDDVLRNASAALRAASRRGASYIEVYDAATHGPALADNRLERDLRRAVEEGQFHLVYQPVVVLRSRRIVAVEAFLRWHHPERGPVPAVAFIPVAEETQLIVPLGRWVLQEVCRQLGEWQEQLGPGGELKAMVNLSPRHFLSRSFLDDLKGALLTSRLPAERLVLELTEAAVARGLPRFRQRMAAVRQLGVQLALDDYTGRQRALADLAQMPVDYVKVDSSLVAQLTLRPEEHAAIKSIVALGRLARIPSVAEGLEREDQLAELLRFRCEFGQGTLFAEPMPAGEVFKLLSRG